MTIVSKTNGASEKTILLVNTGSAKKRFIVQKLKRMGVKLVVLNKEKNWAQPYVDYWILSDNTNHNESLQSIKEFLSNNPKIKIDGVLTFWEDDVLLTSKIVDKFNFIGIPFNTAKKARNKFNFRDFCHKNNLPVPKYKMVRRAEDLKEITENFNFPVVIKPVYGSSSAFVIKVEKQEDLLEMFQYVKSNISTNVESALADGLDILVEEFIDGDEVDIDILLQNGKVKFFSLADNFNKNKGIFFVDSGQAIPSSLPEKCQDDLLETAEIILEKLGIQNGCIHFEAKYSKRGVYPIEVNIRMGGDYVYSYTKSAWGVDLIEYAVKIATGEYFTKIKKPSVPKEYIIGWDLHPNESGMLVELDAPEDIKKNWFVEEIEIYKKIGDPIFVPPEGFEHLGWMTVTGENVLDAQDNLEAALKLVSYKVVKFDSDSSLGKTERKNRFSPAVLNKNLLIRNAKIKAIKGADLTNIRKLRIGLLGNVYANTDNPIELRSSQSMSEVETTLRSKGYEVCTLNLNNFIPTVDKLKKGDIDLVLNLGNRLYNNFELRPHIAALLDSLQIPYTGADSFSLFLAADKIQFKKLLAYHEIPTPDWDYFYDREDQLEEQLKYPLIVKPANSNNSEGITDQSVVINEKRLNEEKEKIIQKMGKAALVEEYIEGDEYEVYILGNNESNLQVLPLHRSIFPPTSKEQWNIYTFDAKWKEGKRENEIIHQLPPKNISKKLESLITEIALDTYTIFKCRDYGKVEIKVDSDNNPYVIELNPSPWLCSLEWGGIVKAAQLIGIDYGMLLEQIIMMAVERYRRNKR
ncbi:MAG: hypothetical protein COY66_03200 [Candidatus Kerfeldbacteria bacterium CG_4_10_14_0_8_um_filter_42_10]|uniref:ATP-grasp domain-containing protein n=1 Tax=Candidatus Kerfeldbacteria bacterium CG_4_10_14_0_8_um_filter_42_10 TaxID=2014248 RepID=A0A2M7RJV4_9BACT|nr:MAG: hypothetical protein COY66_03200 [Candidatus Kerfeldbacteria bacterium CG_4_10_14_0_8_um_filter_42_10]